MKNLSKISKVVMYAILAISVVAIALLFILRGSDGHYGDLSGDYAGFSGLDILLWWAYILLIFGVLAAVVMTIVNAGKNPGGSKAAVYGLVVLAVVLVASFLLSSNDPVPVKGGKEFYTNDFGLRVTDMGLYTAYFAMIAAVGAVVWGAVKNSFK